MFVPKIAQTSLCLQKIVDCRHEFILAIREERLPTATLTPQSFPEATKSILRKFDKLTAQDERVTCLKVWFECAEGMALLQSVWRLSYSCKFVFICG